MRPFTPAAFSDRVRSSCHVDLEWQVRLLLLHTHGGLFIDGTVLLTAPLSANILTPISSPATTPSKDGPFAFVGFFNERNMVGCARPVIETSFLLAPPRHPLVRAWLNEFSSLPNSSCTAQSVRDW